MEKNNFLKKSNCKIKDHQGRHTPVLAALHHGSGMSEGLLLC
jgi:hypothetical protein